MYFANDKSGGRIYIGDAKAGDSFFCPACGEKMVIKRGNIYAHHFAHMPGMDCDPWYTSKLSDWHIKMQRYFRPENREIIIWNSQHTEYHIADIALKTSSGAFVFEFQHSPISQTEFIARSSFYIKCGYSLIWIFDFCECKKYKRILIADKHLSKNACRLVWPGKDRIRFLDNLDFSAAKNNLHIIFYLRTGKGQKKLHSPNGYYPWETWEYVNPLNLSRYFAVLHLDKFTDVSDFIAHCYTEREFCQKINRLIGRSI